jgi:short-subunit dehydrogenase
LSAKGEELRAAGATDLHYVTFDAARPDLAGDAVSAAFDALSTPVDLVVIAVGLLGDQAAMENDAAASAEMASVNYSWPVAALAEIRRRLVAQGSGRIVVYSSVAAIRVRRDNYLYSGAKAGLDRFCEGLADSLEGSGVSLQIIRPGMVRTKMTAGMKDAPFTTTVDVCADNIVAGFAGSSRIITSPPILKWVFLVLLHLPRPLWRKLSAAK